MLTYGFVGSILPVKKPNDEELNQALNILGQTKDDIRCVYCGNAYNQLEHFRPLVKNGRPTGYITEIRNLVPSCGTCNYSKGNSDWKEWMSGNAPKSPKSRGIKDIDARIQALERYEQWGNVHPFDVELFRQELGEERWDTYWEYRAQIEAVMRKAHEESQQILAILEKFLDNLG